jgi:hypothetical protein
MHGVPVYTCSLRAAGSRRQRTLAAHNADAAIADETYYRDSSDYRSVLNLNELHRFEQQPFSSCVTCSTSGSSDPAKQQTVVCTLRNARTATLVHRIQQPNDIGLTTHQHGNNGRHGNDVGGLLRWAGDVDVVDALQEKDARRNAEMFCHSPYCIYAKTLTGPAGIGSIDVTMANSAGDGNNMESLEQQQQSKTCPGESDDGGQRSLMSNQLNLGRCLAVMNSHKNNFVTSSLVEKASFQTQIPSMTMMDNDLTRSCLVAAFSPGAQVDIADKQAGNVLQV